MTDKTEKKEALRNVVIESLDDMSGAIDDFGSKLDSITTLMQHLLDQMGDLDGRLERIESEARENHQYLVHEVSSLDTTVSNLSSDIENLNQAMPDVAEVVEDIHRRDLNDMRHSLRRAKSAAAFIDLLE